MGSFSARPNIVLELGINSLTPDAANNGTTVSFTLQAREAVSQPTYSLTANSTASVGFTWNGGSSYFATPSPIPLWNYDYRPTGLQNRVIYTGSFFATHGSDGNGGTLSGSAYATAPVLGSASAFTSNTLSDFDRSPTWISQSLLNSATVGTPYSDTVAANNAASYSVFSGTLPPGLSLNTSTGTISGTPTANGQFSFVIRATGSFEGAVNTGTLIITVTSASARIWNGTSFVDGITKVWNGTTFVSPARKIWSGSIWQAPLSVQCLVIGGGGGAGWDFGSGGGAGGYRSFTTTVKTLTNYAVSVGAGGSGGGFPSGVPVSGNPSSFNGLRSAGGGKGTNGSGAIQNSTPGSGGSGGGGAGWVTTNGALVGSGNIPSVSPSQGNSGGRGNYYGGSPAGGAGGGGGAGAVGNAATTSGGGAGGSGILSTINGSSTFRAGGGGGGSYAPNTGTGGAGGTGGGGAGASAANSSGTSGTANTGGGGGGAAGGGQGGTGGNGGSGVVILRYPNTFTITIGAGLTGSTANVGSDRVTTITAGTGNVSWV